MTPRAVRSDQRRASEIRDVVELTGGHLAVSRGAMPACRSNLGPRREPVTPSSMGYAYGGWHGARAASSAVAGPDYQPRGYVWCNRCVVCPGTSAVSPEQPPYESVCDVLFI